MTLFDVRKQERQALKRHAEYMAGIHDSNAKALRKEKRLVIIFVSGMVAIVIASGWLWYQIHSSYSAENNIHRGETTSQISQW